MCFKNKNFFLDNFKNKNLDQVKVDYDCGYGESQFYEKEKKGPVNIGLKNSSKKKNH